MIGTAVRIYRCQNRLSQLELARKTFLNQSDISELERGVPETIEHFHNDSGRFSFLKELIGSSSDVAPIKIFKRTEVQDDVGGNHEWVVFAHPSRKDDCDRLFAGRDVDIILQS